MKRYLLLLLLAGSVYGQRVIENSDGITLKTGGSNPIEVDGNLTVATNVTLNTPSGYDPLTVNIGGVLKSEISDIGISSSVAVIGSSYLGVGASVGSYSGMEQYLDTTSHRLASNVELSWTDSSTDAFAGNRDTRLFRDAANTLALRNGANSNTFRVYGTYTDASNYARSSLSHDGTSTTTLAGETAGTGSDDQSLKIKLSGAGKFGVFGDNDYHSSMGINSIAIQPYTANATRTSSGANSTAIGNNATAAASYSTAVGGLQPVASQVYATAVGGLYSTASGAYSTAVGANAGVASGSYSSVVGGYYANAYLYGQHAYASGQFATAGDAQGSRLVMRNTTTGSSADLFLDGSSARAVIPANTTWMFEITVSARSTDGGTGDEESGGWKFIGVIERDGANNTALVGTVGETVVSEDDTDWSVVVSADDTNDALDINVTSDDANTVRWTAVVTLTETGG